ncbi:MAG: hypothetical protein JSW50_05340, partial [Candidatus Latescibacterota bacterium]
KSLDVAPSEPASEPALRGSDSIYASFYPRGLGGFEGYWGTVVRRRFMVRPRLRPVESGPDIIAWFQPAQPGSF